MTDTLLERIRALRSELIAKRDALAYLRTDNAPGDLRPYSATYRAKLDAAIAALDALLADERAGRHRSGHVARFLLGGYSYAKLMDKALRLC